jgi:uncharacterized protein
MKSILWEDRDRHSLEYFQLAPHAYGITLEGTVVLLMDGLPARVSYKVECNLDWRTKTVSIERDLAGDLKQLTLEVSDHQMWRAGDTAISFADGIFDVDLEITPATNTLPTRRIALKEGESRELDALWVRFPSLTLERLPQRYTRIGRNLYRYEALLSGFQTELEVDESGLVTHYHGYWRHVGN